MISRTIQAALHRFGYDIHRIPRSPRPAGRLPKITEPISAQAIWPLPRRPRGPSDDAIRHFFHSYDEWQYAYEFEGRLSFSVRHAARGDRPDPIFDAPSRHLRRFEHFMPHLLAAEGGSLKGKRVLDIACNSGFWLLQCALLDAEVVGFDARLELIEQTGFIKDIAGVENATFKNLDVWDMSPASLGGEYDIMLNLGILHVVGWRLGDTNLPPETLGTRSAEVLWSLSGDL